MRTQIRCNFTNTAKFKCAYRKPGTIYCCFIILYLHSLRSRSSNNFPHYTPFTVVGIPTTFAYWLSSYLKRFCLNKASVKPFYCSLGLTSYQLGYIDLVSPWTIVVLPQIYLYQTHIFLVQINLHGLLCLSYKWYECNVTHLNVHGEINCAAHLFAWIELFYSLKPFYRQNLIYSALERILRRVRV